MDSVKSADGTQKGWDCERVRTRKYMGGWEETATWEDGRMGDERTGGWRAGRMVAWGMGGWSGLEQKKFKGNRTELRRGNILIATCSSVLRLPTGPFG